MRGTNTEAPYISTLNLIFLFSACDSKELALNGKEEDLDHSLVYDCGNIEPQAESNDDRSLILQYLPEVAKELRSEDKRVALCALAVASEMGDLRRTEILIIEHLCEARSEGS